MGGRGICTRSDKFRIPGIVDIILYRKSTFNYTGYDVPFEPHKTRGWSYPPFSIYALDNSGLDRGTVREISVSTHSFSLKICTHVIYIYINRLLGLQTNRACIAYPVESESLPIES